MATCPPDALGTRLDAVRRALALYESTFAQYRSEPVDNADTTDWLIVEVVTARAANGAEAAARWAEQRGSLPWEDVRADLETAARRIADELRSCAYRLTTRLTRRPPGAGPRSREADRAAVRAGLAETAREPGRDKHPNATCVRSRPGAGCGGWPTTCPARERDGADGSTRRPRPEAAAAR